jgi:hypothetical protein
MRKSVTTGFASSALISPIALLLVAMPPTPAAAVDADEMAGACEISPKCLGTWNPDGSWTGVSWAWGLDDPTTITCPPNQDCFLERRGAGEALVCATS